LRHGVLGAPRRHHPNPGSNPISARGLKAHGESDPEQLALLAHRRIKATPEELCEAMRGRVTPHHRFLLSLHLQQIDAIDAPINAVDREVDALIEPFFTTVQLLTTIPGVDELAACVILAEIGRDMSRFPTAGHPGFRRGRL
jgi:transposase